MLPLSRSTLQTSSQNFGVVTAAASEKTPGTENASQISTILNRCCCTNGSHASYANNLSHTCGEITRHTRRPLHGHPHVSRDSRATIDLQYRHIYAPPTPSLFRTGRGQRTYRTTASKVSLRSEVLGATGCVWRPTVFVQALKKFYHFGPKYKDRLNLKCTYNRSLYFGSNWYFFRYQRGIESFCRMFSVLNTSAAKCFLIR